MTKKTADPSSDLNVAKIIPGVEVPSSITQCKPKRQCPYYAFRGGNHVKQSVVKVFSDAIRCQASSDLATGDFFVHPRSIPHLSYLN